MNQTVNNTTSAAKTSTTNATAPKTHAQAILAAMAKDAAKKEATAAPKKVRKAPKLNLDKIVKKAQEKVAAAKKATKKAPKKAAAKKPIKVAKKVADDRNFISGDAVITKLVKENPRAKGTWGWESFKLIRNGMTVDQFVKAGGRRKDLRWDIAHNYVSVK
jgi:hypothetical protein